MNFLIPLVVAVLESIPKLINSINEDMTLSEEQKKKHLFDLNVALTEANVKVQAVRFKEVESAPVYPPKP